MVVGGDFPTARYSHTSTLMNSLMIVIGGRNEKKEEGNGAVRDIGVLDLENMKWIKYSVYGY